jgi:hypothetical protein
MCALPPHVHAPSNRRNVVDDLEHRDTAKSLISVHGLRARAVVTERKLEARLMGDASALARWENVQAAITELGRTGPARARIQRNSPVRPTREP